MMKDESLVRSRMILEVLARRYARRAANATEDIRVAHEEFAALQHEQCPEENLERDKESEGKEMIEDLMGDAAMETPPGFFWLAPSVPPLPFRKWARAMRRAIRACDWPNCPHVSNETLFNLVSSIDVNCFECYKAGTRGAAMGAACYLGGVTLLNHSCDPNCWVEHDLPTLGVATSRPIEAGEMLTIAYIDTSLPFEERQERLHSQYGFECTCSRCVEEAKKRRPPRLLLWMHMCGAHYILTLGGVICGYYVESIVCLLTYFFVWLKVLGYEL